MGKIHLFTDKHDVDWELDVYTFEELVNKGNKEKDNIDWDAVEKELLAPPLIPHKAKSMLLGENYGNELLLKAMKKPNALPLEEEYLNSVKSLQYINSYNDLYNHLANLNLNYLYNRYVEERRKDKPDLLNFHEFVGMFYTSIVHYKKVTNNNA